MYCDFTLSVQNKHGFTIWPEEAKQKEEQDAISAAEARLCYFKQRETERKEIEQAAANAAANQITDGRAQVIDTGHTPEESKNAA